MFRHLVFFIFIGFINTANSQFSWEPSIGINYSKLSFREGRGDYAYGNPNSTYDVGWQIGYYFHLNIEKFSSLKLGCLYNNLRTTQSYLSDNREAVHKEISLGYLKIPFQYEAAITLTEQSKILLTLGHYMQFGVGGFTKITFRDQTFNKAASYGSINYNDIDKRHFYYNPIDMGFSIGAGFQIKQFIISGEFCYSLFNTLPRKQTAFLQKRDDENFSRINLEKNRWRYITFSLSYRIPFLKN